MVKRSTIDPSPKTPFNTPVDGVSFVLKGSDTHMTNPASDSIDSDSMSTDDNNCYDPSTLKCEEILKDGTVYCFPPSPTPIQRISGDRALFSVRGKLTFNE